MKKFNLFLKIAKLLNESFGIKPVLYGSLGLSVLLETPLKINDVDILVPQEFVSARWSDLCELMRGFGFSVSSEKEHEFKNGDETVAFASNNELADIHLTTNDLKDKILEGVSFQELSPEQHLAVYRYVLKDGYRLAKRSDKEKIDLLEKYLSENKR